MPSARCVTPQRLQERLTALGRVLAGRDDALALLALGSLGLETSRIDAWSDLDFFVIVRDGAKSRYIDNLDWLAAAHPVDWSFPNTSDGRKALMSDGVFCEFAVFELHELDHVPYSPGRFVWRRDCVGESLAYPARALPPPHHEQWLIGEALSNLIVGLLRHARGEKLSAMRLVQVYAVDRVLELLETRQPRAHAAPHHAIHSQSSDGSNSAIGKPPRGCPPGRAATKTRVRPPCLCSRWWKPRPMFQPRSPITYDGWRVCRIELSVGRPSDRPASRMLACSQPWHVGERQGMGLLAAAVRMCACLLVRSRKSRPRDAGRAAPLPDALVTVKQTGCKLRLQVFSSLRISAAGSMQGAEFQPGAIMKTLAIAVLLAGTALDSMAAESVGISMNLVDENGVAAAAGKVVVTETKYGLVFTPELTGLPAGLHGFHVHESPSCLPKEKDGKKVAALAAGGHFDPQNTGKHGFPWGDGHLGDLPPLHVGADGKANQPVLAPRLKLGDLKGRSLMVHAGGDNHADHPAPLGGGGARVACGVVP